jgi:hypothetical protein
VSSTNSPPHSPLLVMLRFQQLVSEPGSFKNMLTPKRWIPVVYMDRQEGISKNKPLVFDGTHYSFWIIQMKSFILSQGLSIWKSIAGSYTKPNTPPTDTIRRKQLENNEKEKNSILCGLTNSVFTKVTHYKFSK